MIDVELPFTGEWSVRLAFGCILCGGILTTFNLPSIGLGVMIIGLAWLIWCST